MFLACESHDLSQAEKEKNEQIYKMGTIFTLNGHRLSFWVNIVVILIINSALQAVNSFSAWDRSRDTTAKRNLSNNM